MITTSSTDIEISFSTVANVMTYNTIIKLNENITLAVDFKEKSQHANIDSLPPAVVVHGITLIYQVSYMDSTTVLYNL